MAVWGPVLPELKSELPGVGEAVEQWPQVPETRACGEGSTGETETRAAGTRLVLVLTELRS